LKRESGKLKQSVVVSCLGEEEAAANNPIDQPVFLGDPAGPGAATQVFEGFGLSQTGAWIPSDRLDELKDFQCRLTIPCDPPGKIIKKIAVEDQLVHFM
jgi:hypothetical protein